MPSIIIGGENTNVGLRYMDELARQRELALREAAFARSASSGDSGASGANNFGSGYTSTQKAYKAPQNAQETTIAPNGGGATGGGLSDDYNQRILQMRKLYANQQNEDNQRRLKDLDGEIQGHEGSLKTMAAMLKDAQTPEQAESMISSMQQLLQRKTDATNEMRQRQSRHPMTGEASTDQALSFIPHEQSTPVTSQDESYRAMGKFAVDTVHAKQAEKDKLLSEANGVRSKNQRIANLQKNVAELARRLQNNRSVLASGSPESVAALGDQTALIAKFEQASKALDDAMENPDHIDSTQDWASSFKSAGIEAQDRWKRQGEIDAFNKQEREKASKMSDAELKQKTDTLKDTFIQKAGIGAMTKEPEGVRNYIELQEAEYKARFGEELPEERKEMLMRANPSYNIVQKTTEEVSHMDTAGAIQHITKLLNDYDTPIVLSQEVDADGRPGKARTAPAGVILAQKQGLKIDYVKQKLLQMRKQIIDAANAQAGGEAYVIPGQQGAGMVGGKPQGYKPQQGNWWREFFQGTIGQSQQEKTWRQPQTTEEPPAPTQEQEQVPQAAPTSMAPPQGSRGRAILDWISELPSDAAKGFGELIRRKGKDEKGQEVGRGSKEAEKNIREFYRHITENGDSEEDVLRPAPPIYDPGELRAPPPPPKRKKSDD